MGIGLSKPNRRGIILSLDALGTLYRFRAPVATQYLAIAQKCGLKSPVKLPDLEASFKEAFKSTNKDFPNYGKDKLPDPEAWWTELVTRSFKPLVNEELPPDLGHSLYQHFSSHAAYEVYPDVHPFLQRMNEIRHDPGSPMLMIGIITNSDPRVKQILESMNLKIGLSKLPSLRPNRQELEQTAMEDAEASSGGRLQVTVPWGKLWKVNSNFDFLATSYDADSEKPDPGIILYTRQMTRLLHFSRVFQELPRPKTFLGAMFQFITTAIRDRRAVEGMTWVHVGDDYDKDVAPAKVRTDIAPGFKVPERHAIHLVREGEGTPVEGTDTVTDLIEVASIINLMIQDPRR